MGKRVIFYGLGRGALHVKSKLKNDVEIVAYTDSYAKIHIYDGMTFIPLSKLCLISWDYIIVTIQDRKVSLEVTKMLVVDYKIKRERIIPYYCCINTELYKDKLINGDLNARCLIVGNSHAFYGLQEEGFAGGAVNISVPGQDLYYSYFALKKVEPHMQRLKTVILDMYDYTYLNVDASKAYGASHYYLGGGILEQHNFNENSKFGIYETPLKMLEDCYNYDFLNQNNLCDMCNMDFVYLDDPREKYEFIPEDPPLLSNLLLYGGKNKRNVTIEENITILDNMSNYIRERGYNLIFTLLPRYWVLDSLMEVYYENWKKFFMKEIDELKIKYGATFINYKLDERISKNNRFYFDAAHLNTIGGCAMTSILSEDLEKNWGI